ncbi:hypothetical protein M406DRAFT_354026 [Cryphonectria parasitica EP155]|uniref:Uncharacterized protein n=1 Tax=Cryphonectria parasitica (strain ATCC 38755 / EP155) TaxID=660469 RepID=A0A9P4YAJ5_CRYP1|nr:uncharacterized protein M406DRAFT_354026 [Cryphonectria parasitica EP155]KAF3769480.1 hypothetical protein M406DRAFT_354026 [Cryphonectria parasitica EP155]
MPLMADTTAVDFIGPDPRPISPDLHQVWFGTDSRQIPKFWSELESSLGVRAGQDAGMPVDCRVLLASCPWDGHGMTDGIVTFLISNRKTADIYLTKETRDACDFLGSKLALGGWRRSVERFTPEMNPRSLQEWVDGRVPNTAVGFWLIDPAQLGPPSEPDAMDFPDNEPAVLNLAGRDSKMESCLFGLRGLRN